MKHLSFFLLMITLLTSCGSENIETTSTKIETKTSSKILALGDSLTAGYNLDINESYPAVLEDLLRQEGYNFKITNAGVSGDTSKNLVGRIDLYTDEYDIILLNIGGNDGLRSLSTTQLKENILTTIDTFSDSKIVLFSIDLPFNYGAAYRKSLQKVYDEVSKERDVYYYGLFFEGLDYSKHFLPDRIHPNAEGYKIIAQNISDYLLKNKIITND